MTLIYMQETIDYMFKLNPASLNDLEKLGAPVPVELLDGKGITKTKYYRYESSSK